MQTHIVTCPICIDKLFISADLRMISATNRDLSSQIFTELILYTWIPFRHMLLSILPNAGNLKASTFQFIISRSKESLCGKDWAVRSQKVVRVELKRPSGQYIKSSECQIPEFGLYWSCYQICILDNEYLYFSLTSIFLFLATGLLYFDFFLN